MTKGLVFDLAALLMGAIIALVILAASDPTVQHFVITKVSSVDFIPYCYDHATDLYQPCAHLTGETSA